MVKENFKALVKGGSIDNIIKALNYWDNSLREELMQEYNASSIEELAFKLQ